MRAATAPEETPRPALSIGPRELRYQRFRVRVVAGPDAGLEVVSSGAAIAIGAAPGNHLVLADRAVSRHHCEIRAGEGGFTLRDLASTNGTTVSAVRIAAAYLEPGAVVGVGSSTVHFDVDDAEVREPLSPETSFGPVIGESAAMRRVFALLARAAIVDTPVLVEGEPGTGKGLVAEAIHRASPRAGRPLVVVDCGALPPSRIARELFDHARGACGGSLFLDEIGELALEVQPEVLRALEATPDVRIIAATHRDLREEVNRGRFRDDLFHRLDGMRVRLPALRERREDIALLAAHFYRQAAGCDDLALAHLLSWVTQRRWPGNVRELRAVVERAPRANRGDGGDAGAVVDGSFHDAKQQLIDEWERAYLRALMRQFRGNLSQAGLAVSLDRNHLRLLLVRHGIDKKHP